jgi:hypothetical protein
MRDLFLLVFFNRKVRLDSYSCCQTWHQNRKKTFRISSMQSCSSIRSCQTVENQKEGFLRRYVGNVTHQSLCCAAYKHLQSRAGDTCSTTRGDVWDSSDTAFQRKGSRGNSSLSPYLRLCYSPWGLAETWCIPFYEAVRESHAVVWNGPWRGRTKKEDLVPHRRLL